MTASGRTFLGTVGQKMKESLDQFAHVWGATDYHPPFAAKNLITVDPDLPAPGDLQAEVQYQARLIYREEGDFAYQQDKAIFKLVHKHKELKQGLTEGSLTACVNYIVEKHYDKKWPKSKIVFKKQKELEKKLAAEIVEIKQMKPQELKGIIQGLTSQLASMEKNRDEKINPERKQLDLELKNLPAKHKVENDLKKYNRIIESITRLKEERIKLLKAQPKKDIYSLVMQLTDKDRELAGLRLVLKIFEKRANKLRYGSLKNYLKEERELQARLGVNIKLFESNHNQINALRSEISLKNFSSNINDFKSSRRRDFKDQIAAIIKLKRDEIVKILTEFVVHSKLIEWVNQSINIRNSELANLYQAYTASKNDDDLKKLILFIKAHSNIYKEFSKHITDSHLVKLIHQKIKWDEKHPSKPFRPPYWCALSEFTTKKLALSNTAKNAGMQHSPSGQVRVLSLSRPHTPSKTVDVEQVALDEKKVGDGSLGIDTTLPLLRSGELKSPNSSPGNISPPKVASPLASPRHLDQKEQALIELEMPTLSSVGLSHNPVRLLNCLAISGPINVAMQIPGVKWIASPVLIVKAAVDGLVEAASYTCSYGHRYKDRKKKAAERVLFQKINREKRKLEDSKSPSGTPAGTPRGTPRGTVASVNQKLQLTEVSVSRAHTVSAQEDKKGLRRATLPKPPVQDGSGTLTIPDALQTAVRPAGQFNSLAQTRRELQRREAQVRNRLFPNLPKADELPSSGLLADIPLPGSVQSQEKTPEIGQVTASLEDVPSQLPVFSALSRGRHKRTETVVSGTSTVAAIDLSGIPSYHN